MVLLAKAIAINKSMYPSKWTFVAVDVHQAVNAFGCVQGERRRVVSCLTYRNYHIFTSQTQRPRIIPSAKRCPNRFVPWNCATHIPPPSASNSSKLPSQLSSSRQCSCLNYKYAKTCSLPIAVVCRLCCGCSSAAAAVAAE